MNKWLFWGLLAAAALLIWKLLDGKRAISRERAARNDRSSDANDPQSTSKEGQASAGKLLSTKVVACAHCDLHLPHDEAITHDEQYFCSKEHRDLVLRKRAS